MTNRLRVVFFGTPQFAVPTLLRLLGSTHNVVGVFTQPDRPRGRGQRVSGSPVKVSAESNGIPVLQPSRLHDPAVTASLTALAPDLGVVAAYGKILPDELLAVPRLGMINVHASLLPKYRGAAPVHRAVIAGESETGVTIMRVIPELDAGGMFARRTRTIADDETSQTVESGLSQLGADLLVEVVDQLATGTASEQPQDPANATYAHRLTKEDGVIDWSLPARAVHNRVRGLYPWPHACSFIKGERLILRRTHVTDDTTSLTAGTIVDAMGDAIQVAGGDGHILAIEELQQEGRRPMHVRDFLAGHPLVPGLVFGRA